MDCLNQEIETEDIDLFQTLGIMSEFQSYIKRQKRLDLHRVQNIKKAHQTVNSVLHLRYDLESLQ